MTLFEMQHTESRGWMLKKVTSLILLSALLTGGVLWFMFGKTAREASHDLKSPVPSMVESPSVVVVPEPKLGATPEKTVTKKSVRSSWEIKNLDARLEQSIRKSYGIERGEVKQLMLMPDAVSQLAVGDVLYLTVPGLADSFEVTVTNISTIGDVKSMAGTIYGLGLGHGVTLSQNGVDLVGSIVTDQDTWSIDTVQGVTFISNGLNNQSHENDAL